MGKWEETQYSKTLNEQNDEWGNHDWWDKGIGINKPKAQLTSEQNLFSWISGAVNERMNYLTEDGQENK